MRRFFLRKALSLGAYRSQDMRASLSWLCAKIRTVFWSIAVAWLAME
jgi:hypothetical protein